MSLFAHLRREAARDWDAYTRHPFVERLSAGVLPASAFVDYLVQDYLFLTQFARANALAAYQCRTLPELHDASAALAAILTETRLHERVVRVWGIGPDELAAATERTATVAYTRYVLDRGTAGDRLDLQVALAPCVLGYAEIGARLAAETAGARDHPYAEWIGEYAGADYQATARAAQARLDDLGAEAGPRRRSELVDVFAAATRLEAAFWQQSLDVVDAGQGDAAGRPDPA